MSLLLNGHAAAVPIPPSGPDQSNPQIPRRLSHCPDCKRSLGDFVVCKGASTASNRGRTMQLCSNRYCNYAIFYSDAYTVFQHAEAVAKYYNAHSPAYAPPLLAFPAPHASHPPLPAPLAKTPANPVDKCSVLEFEDTKVAGTFWRECAAHMKRTRQRDGPVNPTLAQTPSIPILLVPNPTSPKVQEDIPIPAWSTPLSNSEISMAAQIRSQAKRASQVVVRDLKQVSRTNVNLIMWHSGSPKPYRYRLPLPSYPNFSLSLAHKLVNEILIHADDAIETWIPAHQHWEQHSLETTRTVRENDRLLYKLIRTVTATIDDSACLGLEEELSIQHSLGKRKCRLDDLVSPTIPSSTATLSPSSSTSSALSSPLLASSRSPTPHDRACLFTLTLFPTSRSSTTSTSLSHNSGISPPPSKRLRPSPGDNLLKKNLSTTRVWPQDFHVSVIDKGFDYIECGQQQRRHLKTLFMEVFHQPVVHSTFNMLRKWYTTKADNMLKSIFIDYGESPEGLWPAFTTACRAISSPELPQPLLVVKSEDDDIVVVPDSPAINQANSHII
ncbi:hypothetical protein JB92DRAFT_3107151 [Gautieria morchelliformis]|nr:hypothetical protein JB92DRAFT_3107151 [Gautieria morchelliformis]